MTRRALRSLLLALLVPLLAAAGAEAPLFNADGYRIARYRAPVPTTPAGVKRVSASEVAKLRDRQDVLLIDVMPAEGGHREPDGRWRLALPRTTIPGAHWFPEAGRGDPDPAIAAAFAHGIERLSHGRHDRTIVVFCLSDCWMSWNAARRLAARGYRDVRWLADGTDGWSALYLPLVNAVPEGGVSVP